MTFVTSATNAEVSEAQPYYFQSNTPSIHTAFICHEYVKGSKGYWIYMKQAISESQVREVFFCDTRQSLSFLTLGTVISMSSLLPKEWASSFPLEPVQMPLYILGSSVLQYVRAVINISQASTKSKTQPGSANLTPLNTTLLSGLVLPGETNSPSPLSQSFDSIGFCALSYGQYLSFNSQSLETATLTDQNCNNKKVNSG